jgi:hypothetical protein
MKRIDAIAFVTLSIVIGAACVTPSIPIPPPSPERMEFAIDTSAGLATFSYPANKNYADAIVYVFNRDRKVGVITVADPTGRVAATPSFAAGLGEQVNVTFEREDQAVSTCVRLRNGNQSNTDVCD